MYRIVIKGDFRQVDARLVEGYLRALVADVTGAPPARVILDGVDKLDVDRIRERLSPTR